MTSTAAALLCSKYQSASRHLGLSALIADYYEAHGNTDRSDAVRRGSTDLAVRALMVDLSNANALALSASRDAEAALRRAEVAEGALKSATQPLAAEMARLNARVIELNETIDRLHASKSVGFVPPGITNPSVLQRFVGEAA